MKKQLITSGLVLTLSLVGCQTADNDGATGTTTGNNNTGIQPTQYHDRGSVDGTDARNYMLQRDADWFQNREENTGQNNNDRVNTRNINNQVNDNRNENRYEVGEEAANKITNQMDEIDSAYVLTTENNAYVAAELDTDNNNRGQRNDNNTFDDELSDEVKEKIGDIVKSVDRDIDNVYVSTNPDFFNLTNNYAEDVDRGEPIEGFFDQFSNMIERIFPQNR
ncbi:YhcN/YlaJ family sporulation lipoprotein [Oceanobacillus bengalensis]|uniref:YhcN/YlaJ family sporulation lipoprotein n=1 Tax=Oceanobacillus bengalensis TaxID=1435466 RepID=A0A494Z9Q4_9BACI|nr:YhcN/YlaJ family sporulation lipoprotein [Oceanobacillus bengalensis]RKQ18769.1 YhcN/YlaJ family sporulation lipoprotein [Oceanobacillus bengalensis]